ncbi:hypothetical protein FHY55_19850 [Oceanicola sp. D3]|uniref:hypothetical protein n=1 Tax=Oceanicola sp. D3 TaxID=2587163 RepID=UPI00112106AF|nr:hypothetical protein [Oceanicola sp. D3]QDC11348.1 hypothetical protein FHY55_19850 [Oceanicola sp. D3]
MTSLRRLLLCGLIALSLSGCRPYPDRLLIEGASAHRGAWPILYGESTINGRRLFAFGEGRADLRMPPPTDSSVLALALYWAEYHSGESWVAEVELPLTLADRFQGTANLKVVIGRMGAIEIMSGPFGEEELRSTGVICGTRTPELDATYTAEIEYLAKSDGWDAPGQPSTAAPASPCEGR